jgi:hypothetical protein
MRDRLPVVLLAVLAAAALALAAPAPAPAADADVYAAWVSEQAAMQSTSTALSRAMKRAERARFRRVGAVVRHLRRLEVLTVAVRDRVLMASASTPSGSIARGEALESLDGFMKSLRNLRLAVQAASKGRAAAARRYLRRSARLADSAELDATDASVFFERARGEVSPPPVITQPPPPPPPPPSPPPPPPCTDQDPNVGGCQTQCEADQDPNVGGCQTQCEADQDPNVGGCQTQCQADQDPNVDNCQTQCQEDQNPYQEDCQTSEPACAATDSCLPCEVDPTAEQCQSPPARRAALTVRSASSLPSGASRRASADRRG